jgi:catechol 2,3-dioxygenase-like lactoylglutathione lyase family enzyme
MYIRDVSLGTADLPGAVEFYRSVLELPVEMRSDVATVTVGRSTITLVERPATREGNHIAFTIPRNQFSAAKRWLVSRTALMTWGPDTTELRLGEPWNSESVYFLGPDRIILELITRQRLDNAVDHPFSSADLLCVSEVGLSAPKVADSFARLQEVFGVEDFAGASPDFAAAGDQDGLLIVVRSDRPWFPTDDVRADTPAVAVTLGGVSAGVVRSPVGWSVTAP